MGEDSYKSVFGGFFTLIGSLIALLYLSGQLQSVVYRSNTSVTYSNIKTDLSDPNLSPPLNLTIDNFSFKIKLDFLGPPNVFNKSEIDRYFSPSFKEL